MSMKTCKACGHDHVKIDDESGEVVNQGTCEKFDERLTRGLNSEFCSREYKLV